MDKFVIEQGIYGMRMTLTSREWSGELTEYVLSNNIKELYLNIAFGWSGNDLSFLKDLTGLQWLKILTDYIEDASPIQHLLKLRTLEVTATCRSPLDLSLFPCLESVSLHWNNKVKSIFQCCSLKDVYVYTYKSKDKTLSAFSQLPNLESLHLKNTSFRQIGDLSALKKLRVLQLRYASKLESLQGLEILTGLRKLELLTCRKISKIDPIRRLKNLDDLCLCNCGDIESLKPIANLKKLRKFCFLGDTTILDGDMKVLLKLRKLEDVSFNERRHYNLENQDIPCEK